jgi:hypothetical protein
MKFVFILFLVCSVFIYGCESVKTYYVEKENIPRDEVVRIAGVFLKSGGFIDLRNKNAKLLSSGKFTGITYDGIDMKPTSIPADNISVLKIDVVSNNYWVPVAIIGVAAVLAFFAIMIVLRLVPWGHVNITGG